ncbi:hypothetical protein CYB_0264 [Synechococcus sp. JA-2-3B'a(2-13)]|nr:hypothetical protein CYB_0264 [Synechococcus sp. JA-2-3B'a(2-13)]
MFLHSRDPTDRSPGLPQRLGRMIFPEPMGSIQPS